MRNHNYNGRTLQPLEWNDRPAPLLPLMHGLEVKELPYLEGWIEFYRATKEQALFHEDGK